MSRADILNQALLPETKRNLATYEERGITGCWAKLVQLAKDYRTPKTAVINPNRGEAYYNGLPAEFKTEVLLLTKFNALPAAAKSELLATLGIDDTVAFHKFNDWERAAIGRTLRHLKLVSNRMPDSLKIADFFHVQGGQNG